MRAAGRVITVARAAIDRFGALDRRGIAVAFAVWTLVYTFEYFYLGPRSFIWMDDEGELLVTHYNFINAIHTGGQYSHLMAAGADVAGTFLIGSAYVSLDRLLLGVFPLWIGILLHKTLTCVVALVGTYLVCRRGMGTSRPAAAAVAMLFTVFYYRLLIVTFGSGTSWALLAIGVYLCVLRLGRRRYWLGVAVYALAAAAMFSAYHGLPAALAALATGAVLFNRWNWRVAAAAVVVTVAVLGNNLESFVALIQVAPSSVRFAGSSAANENIDLVSALFRSAATAVHMLIWASKPAGFCLALAAVVFMWRRQWRHLIFGIAAMAVPVGLYALVVIFPWAAIGLAAVSAAPLDYLVFGAWPAIVALFAVALDRAAEGIADTPRLKLLPFAIPAVSATAIAAIIMADYKVDNIVNHFETGGQGVYTTVVNVRERAWAPATPFRAVSLRHKNMEPEQNIFFSFYGVAMFDAWLNLTPRSVGDYWYETLAGTLSASHDFGLDWRFLNIEGEFGYDIGRQASLPMLAIANVRYIFSPLPLLAPGLRFIDGPARPPLDKAVVKLLGNRLGLGSRIERFFARKRWQVERVFEYGKVYIYEIEGALPRVYGATGLVLADDADDRKAFHARIAERALSGAAVVRRSVAAPLLGRSAIAKVVDFRLVTDGFDIRVSAPEGGIIVVNAVHGRFFAARVDGNAAPVVPVNGVQMAVPVPPGARQIEVRYHRPTALELLERALDRLNRS